MMFWETIYQSIYQFPLDCNYTSVTLYSFSNTDVYPFYTLINSLFGALNYLCVLLNYFLIYCELTLDAQASTNIKDALITAIKFLTCITLLIFARGGIPRFRFDYLTKLGWIRFLSLVLLSLLIEVLLLLMF